MSAIGLWKQSPVGLANRVRHPVYEGLVGKHTPSKRIVAAPIHHLRLATSVERAAQERLPATARQIVSPANRAASIRRIPGNV